MFVGVVVWFFVGWLVGFWWVFLHVTELYTYSVHMTICLGIGMQRKNRLRNGDTHQAKLMGPLPLLAPAS